MYPLHDKDLDRLSREAAEHFEAEPGASGWDNLEKRLDIELPQKKKKRRFLFWLVFITATTGGALFAIIKNQPLTPLAKNTTVVVSATDKTVPAQPDSPANTNNTTLVAPSQKATSAQPTGEGQSPLATPSTATTTPVAGNDQPAPATGLNTMPDKSSAAPVAQPGKTTIKKLINNQNTHKSKLSLNYASVTPDNSGNSLAPNAQRSKRKPGKKQNTTAGQHKQMVKQGDNSTLEPDTKVADNDQPVNTHQPDQTADQSTAQQPATVAVDPVKKEETTTPATADSAKTPAAPIAKKKPEKKQDKKVKGLELGLMAGPDLSTVKFGPIYKTGYNFGVQVGYRFSDRWSVNTGVIYTKKFYQADSQDFHYKMPNNYKLKNVEGNCSMWEIPVNVRYDVSFNDKRRWFVSTGLSTYLMDKEDYTVYYSTWSNNVYDWPINSDSNSSYIFSILNLSAGMERSFGKHFSIQAEPYLKIPLKGLGMGSMRMTSYGVLFTLKYKPQFNSKRSDIRK
jgi:hypothetical protein